MDAVRKATQTDVPALAGALARAFHDDPVFEWMFARETSRQRWAKRFFAIRLRQLLGQDEVYGIAGAGAAGWTRPGEWALSLRETVQLGRILPGLGTRTVRVLRGLALVEQHHPREPSHYYLAHLGVEPAAQGRGAGSALMRPVLEGCDADGIPAFLESSKERNIAFYARHGFRVTEEVRLPAGPPIWLMWREPR